jgi:hypothetical protein
MAGASGQGKVISPLQLLYCNRETSRISDKVLECGDLSTCHRFRCLAGLPVKQSRVQRLGATPHYCSFDGDESPAQSADKSAHSKALWFRLGRAGRKSK